METTARQLMERFVALADTQRQRALEEREERELVELLDEMMELGSGLEAVATALPPRVPRVDISLQVTLLETASVVRVYSRDVGLGGVAVATPRPLPRGAKVRLEMSAPEWESPLKSAGEVVWTGTGTMGIAFVDVSDDDRARLKELVARNDEFLDRFRQALAG